MPTDTQRRDTDVPLDASPANDNLMARQIEQVREKLQELEFGFVATSRAVDGLPAQVKALDNRLTDLFLVIQESGVIETTDLDALRQQIAELPERVQEAGARAQQSDGPLQAGPAGNETAITLEALQDLATREDTRALEAAIASLQNALAGQASGASSKDGASSEAFDSAVARIEAAQAAALTEIRAKNQSIEEKVDALAASVAALANAADASAPLESISAKMDALARRPDPVLDLTPQRKLFSRYTAVLDALASRVEAAATRFETDELAALRSHLDALSGSQDAPDTAKLDAILDAVEHIAKRPNPTLDLTAQRKSLASFSAALSTALGRFDTTAESLRSEFDALADRLEDRIAEQSEEHQAPNASDQMNALHTLLETNRQLADAAIQGAAMYPDTALIRDFRFALAELFAGLAKAESGKNT